MARGQEFLPHRLWCISVCLRFVTSPRIPNHIFPCALCCCVHQAFTSWSLQAWLVVFAQTVIKYWLRGLNSRTSISATSGRLEENQCGSKMGSFWGLQGMDPLRASWRRDGRSHPVSPTSSFLCLALCPKSS